MVGGVGEKGFVFCWIGGKTADCVRIDGGWRGEVDGVMNDGGAKWG